MLLGKLSLVSTIPTCQVTQKGVCGPCNDIGIVFTKAYDHKPLVFTIYIKPLSAFIISTI